MYVERSIITWNDGFHTNHAGRIISTICVITCGSFHCSNSPSPELGSILPGINKIRFCCKGIVERGGKGECKKKLLHKEQFPTPPSHPLYPFNWIF